MIVKAAPGTRIPKEGKPRDYITDSQPVTVPDSQYYRRLVRDTSLVEVKDQQAQPAEPDKSRGKKSTEKEEQ